MHTYSNAFVLSILQFQVPGELQDPNLSAAQIPMEEQEAVWLGPEQPDPPTVGWTGAVTGVTVRHARRVRVPEKRSTQRKTMEHIGKLGFTFVFKYTIYTVLYIYIYLFILVV